MKPANMLSVIWRSEAPLFSNSKSEISEFVASTYDGEPFQWLNS